MKYPNLTAVLKGDMEPGGEAKSGLVLKPYEEWLWPDESHFSCTYEELERQAAKVLADKTAFDIVLRERFEGGYSARAAWLSANNLHELDEFYFNVLNSSLTDAFFVQVKE